VGGYVLLGLLAGLSAALGFLLPPRSRLTRMWAACGDWWSVRNVLANETQLAGW